ncbi:bifunctional uridylyltransferase/uridylyl-removing protein GlnD [Vibrio sp.]|nr:bifunctional uridylyltransferase/uridylyl-removing protein GlnD [Vibrio sp.]
MPPPIPDCSTNSPLENRQLPISPKAFSDDQITAPYIKEQLSLFADDQKQRFFQRRSAVKLIRQRTDYIDTLLKRLWDYFHFDTIEHISLIAVGGYGRGELHPLSDIDILLLTKFPLSAKQESYVSEFITLLWDLKLTVGHAVRTLEESLQIGKDDLSVGTNLQESRYLCGDKDLYNELTEKMKSDEFWPSDLFYKAKIQEQASRHARFNNTSYNLEPDIKSSPGGLRDIHTLSWIARRHFGATSLYEMSAFGFLTNTEYRELVECQSFLWRIRFALHLELRRYDNRLTFALQPQVAEHMGYSGQGNRGVEQMMKAFYRTLHRVSELNKMLLKIFDQAILNNGIAIEPNLISRDFQKRKHLIEARKPALFQARPETIIDMFIHISDDASITGIAPNTLRQLRTAKRRLNKYLHTIPEAREKFITLCRHPNSLSKAFQLMHRLGVLSAYLPQWSQIVGQMQFDLFHVYTVDEHSYRVLKHINTFNDPSNGDKHPICCEIYPRIQKKELLTIAAIFHDIGKGRGGDHSEIGAVEAYDFCIEHDFSKPEAKLVSWLVQHHLLMSTTAQRKDIYDPDVIAEFARTIRDEDYLEYLTCLTVADICATNPDLWNGWKRTLMSELYHSTQRALRRGLENPVDLRERVRHNQQMALADLRKENINTYEVERLWQRFKADYFLRHTHAQIAWHSQHILAHPEHTKPMVIASENTSRGGTEIFIYSPDQHALFTRISAELDRKNCNIQDARVMTSKDGYVIDTFIVLDNNNKTIDPSRHKALVSHLEKVLLDGKSLKRESKINIKARRAPSQLKYFKVRTGIIFVPAKNNTQTLLELVALDSPGLLATIGSAFSDLELHLHAAKIITIGERAEDLFILTNKDNQKLNLEEQEALRTLLIDKINTLAGI